ncbi:MAG: excinuclease ABC subunit UvrA [Ignavibacteria bacterium]|nr:excinuclease ABC subunit UvrA [Ignavibacteria bacterium]
MKNQTTNRAEIQIRGARVNNLKNVDVNIPRGTITVVTGLSGSGKSSLAFDTLYAEGQRRFIESLSAYARQFLDRMNKPDVDSIVGLPPAVAIEQQSFSKNPRSTVGTTTEVYDYLRLLYGRIGVVIDKDTGAVVRKDTAESVCEHVMASCMGKKILVLADLPDDHGSLKELKEGLNERGFTRVVVSTSPNFIELDELTDVEYNQQIVRLLVDRLKVKDDEDTVTRLTDSLESTFNVGNGRVVIRVVADDDSIQDLFFSSIFENAQTQTQYIEPEPRLFSFNNPFGACPTCQGFGRSVGIDENLVFTDKSATLKRGAIHPFRGDSFGSWLRMLLKEAPIVGIPADKPIYTFTEEQMAMLWNGFGEYEGINGFFKMLEEKTYKTHYRVILSRYRGYTKCSACKGSRLRTAARQVFVAGKNIPQVIKMTLAEARAHFETISISEHEHAIVDQILLEVRRRLHLLCEIGLEYLTLDRLSHSLSGGESQRINLATSLGSALVGTLYVLDEPSIGLHPRDTNRLLKILSRLKSLGNTVVIVEHDLDVIRTADYVIDVGPLAGEAGGHIVFSGTQTELAASTESLTAKYLSGEMEIPIKAKSNKGNGQSIIVRNPVHHNLKGDDVLFPIGCITCVTGVSGSGKSSLVHDVLFGGINKLFNGYSGEVGACERIEGVGNVTGVEMVDQSAIGRSTRSTPATYTKVFDLIRDVFASTQSAKQLGWKPGHFSFNVSGGRCDTCEGDGRVTIEMQFLPDIELPCEVCNGTRYKREARNILYKGKNIVDVLDMTVNEAIAHFSEQPRIVSKLTTLAEVGLGYIKLGQPSSHLSGGEAQRIKLASHLDVARDGNTLFIFDEPTTGLHVHDVSALINSLERLVEKGHTVVVIEHNLHVMSTSDWIVDMGPEGGADGGYVVATGTPRQIINEKNSYTGQALKQFFAAQKNNANANALKPVNGVK